MEYLIYGGGVLSVLGLIGLGHSVRLALGIKREGDEAKNTEARLQALVAWNMGSLGLAAVGLSMVIIGMLL